VRQRLATTLCLASLFAAPALGDKPQAAARARIEEARKSPLVVLVVDQNDKPVEGVRIEIAQRAADCLFGCNLYMWGQCQPLEAEQAYRERFTAVFDFATLPFYWWAYEPQRGQTEAARLQRMADWCQQNGVRTKGHPLLWNWRDPPWLPDDVEQVKRLSLQRVEDCVRCFAGRIDVWDVVNEAVHFDRPELLGSRQTRMWKEVGRVPLIRAAFKRARDANPNATLLINDYRTDEAYAELIESLRNEDGSFPFDAIGLQAHMHGGAWSNEKIREVCERFARFGLPLHVTELTILSGEPGWERKPWPSTAEGEQRQAEEVKRVYTEFFACPAVKAITWWDFSDQGAWQGAPAGLLRNDMTPKRAYDVLKFLITGEWRSHVSGVTDAGGEFRSRVFRGRYKLDYEWQNPGGSHGETGAVGLIVEKDKVRWGCELEHEGSFLKICLSS
jgi:endo-1,4-beta-xylanase